MNDQTHAPSAGSPAALNSSRPVVAVVILNWNNFGDTQACVLSILAEDYGAVVPIIVDNASTDHSCERLAAAFPDISFVRNERNLGFAAGINRGIRHAVDQSSCKYVVIVNNDCRLAGNAISAAVAEAERDPAVGLITPKILFDEKSRKFWHAGGSISLFFGRSRARGFGEVDHGQYDVAEDTEWASGALMMIRRDVVESAGLLCEDYFFGVEEWDYSLTVRKAGYRIRYCPEFVGYHGGDGSHKNYDPRFIYNFYRNKQIFQERQLGRVAFFFWRLMFRFYVAFAHRRHAIRLALKHGPKIEEEWLDDIKFAAESAIQDHGTNRLSEQTITGFGKKLEERRNLKRPGSGPG